LSQILLLWQRPSVRGNAISGIQWPIPENPFIGTKISKISLTQGDIVELLTHTGSEHKELQVSALADSAQLPQPASAAADWHSTTEQSDGTLVTDALPHATRLSVTPRLQGVVCQPPYWHD